MEDAIGQTAGKVWEFLNKKGEATVADLKKNVDASGDLVNQAIGWLAREEKLGFVKKGKTVKVVLK
jgi:hypothetical protein